MITFVCAFFIALAGGLTYVYARPAEYRATARLKIAPAAMVAEASDTKSTPSVGTDAKSFLSEVQILTSRPLLETAFERLREKGPGPDLGADPVSEMQRIMGLCAMLRAELPALDSPDRKICSRLSGSPC